MTKAQRADVAFDQLIRLQPGNEWHEELEFNEGDIVTVTCTGDGVFYAGLFDREEFARRDKRPFEFAFGTDSYSFTSRMEIPETDDYFLVIRRGQWNNSPAKIRAKVKRVAASQE